MPEAKEQAMSTTEARRHRWLVTALAPEPGDTVLELAAGAGDTGFDALAGAGARARLVVSDVSPAMLDVARRRGAERGVANAEYRAMIGAALGRGGHMVWLDEPAAVAARIRRFLGSPRGPAVATPNAQEGASCP